MEFERLTLADKYHRAVPGYMKRVRDLYEAIFERFGEDGLDLIREVSGGFGTAVAENVKKNGDITGCTRLEGIS